MYMYISVEGQSSMVSGRREVGAARAKGSPHGSILSVKGKVSFAVRVLCLRLDKLFV